MPQRGWGSTFRRDTSAHLLPCSRDGADIMFSREGEGVGGRVEVQPASPYMHAASVYICRAIKHRFKLENSHSDGGGGAGGQRAAWWAELAIAAWSAYKLTAMLATITLYMRQQCAHVLDPAALACRSPWLRADKAGEAAAKFRASDRVAWAPCKQPTKSHGLGLYEVQDKDQIC